MTSAAAPALLENDLGNLETLRTYARSGDAAAFADLVAAYQQMVLDTCRRIVGDASAAEDAAQETFLRLARHAGRVRDNLPGWLHRTATNVALSWIRSESARHQRERSWAADASVRANAEPVPGTELLDQCLAELPDADRDLLVRYHLLGRSQAELATELGLDQSAVSRRLDQARDGLRTSLRRRGAAAALVFPAAMSPAPTGLAMAIRARLAAQARQRWWLALAGSGAIAAILAITIVLVLQPQRRRAEVVPTNPPAVAGPAARNLADDGLLWLVGTDPGLKTGPVERLQRLSLAGDSPGAIRVDEIVPERLEEGGIRFARWRALPGRFLTVAMDRPIATDAVRITLRLRLKPGPDYGIFLFGFKRTAEAPQQPRIILPVQPEAGRRLLAGTWVTAVADYRRGNEEDGAAMTRIEVRVDGLPFYTSLHVRHGSDILLFSLDDCDVDLAAATMEPLPPAR